jgi:hypothetical protein
MTRPQVIDLNAAHREALQTSDDLVQHLAVAKYALAIGEVDLAASAVDAALSLSRAALSQHVEAGRSSTYAGSLVRNTPATATADSDAVQVPQTRQHPAAC